MIRRYVCEDTARYTDEGQLLGFENVWSANTNGVETKSEDVDIQALLLGESTERMIPSILYCLDQEHWHMTTT